MRSVLLVLLIVLPPVVLAAAMRVSETPNRFAEAEPGRLYRGGFPTAKQIRILQAEKHIRTVISLTSDERKPRDTELDSAVRELGLKRYRFPMNGNGTGDLPTLDHAADAMANSSDQPIYFHCSAGDKRSSAALAAYWMKHKGKSLQVTLDDLTRDYDMEFDGEDRELRDYLKQYAEYIGVDSRAKEANGKEQG
jgi:protein tyrosine/serine phosphatase